MSKTQAHLINYNYKSSTILFDLFTTDRNGYQIGNQKTGEEKKKIRQNL